MIDLGSALTHIGIGRKDPKRSDLYLYLSRACNRGQVPGAERTASTGLWYVPRSAINRLRGLISLHEQEQYITTAEAARMLECSLDTVQRDCRNGNVPYKLTEAGHYRIPLSWVERHVNAKLDRLAEKEALTAQVQPIRRKP